MFVRHPLPISTRAPHGETNAFLVGDPAVLVDPAAQTDALDAAVAAHDVAHIALTHTHRDHVAAVDHYATETDATIWARYGREQQFEAATGVSPNRTFTDGTALGTSGVTAMETPGHAPEHTAFCHDGDILVGDLLTADGSVFVGTPGGDMRAYFASLRRLLARDFDTIHPGHGGPVHDPDARIRAVIAHRRDRERRIESAVAGGASTVDDILDAAYEKDLAGLEDLAARTVRAHLEKLDVEHRVCWDGRTARPGRAANSATRNG